MARALRRRGPPREMNSGAGQTAVVKAELRRQRHPYTVAFDSAVSLGVHTTAARRMEPAASANPPKTPERFPSPGGVTYVSIRSRMAADWM
jgi:hypothetical protein